MTDGSRIDYVAAFKREWLVVVAPLIVCLVIGVFMARVAPGSHWAAAQRYSTGSYPGSAAYDIKPDALIAAAAAPVTLRAAEASLDLDAGALNGTVSAVLDKNDANGAVITVTAASKEEALKRATVVGAAVRDQALARYRVYSASQQKQADFVAAQLDSVRSQLTALDAEAAKVPPASRGSYVIARTNLETLLLSYGQGKLALQQGADTVDAAVRLVQSPTAELVKTGGVKISVVLKALLVGLVLGVAVAAVREWLLLRSAAA